MELDNLKEMVHIAKQKQREVIEIYDPRVLYDKLKKCIKKEYLVEYEKTYGKIK